MIADNAVVVDLYWVEKQVQSRVINAKAILLVVSRVTGLSAGLVLAGSIRDSRKKETS